MWTIKEREEYANKDDDIISPNSDIKHGNRKNSLR